MILETLTYCDSGRMDSTQSVTRIRRSTTALAIIVAIQTVLDVIGFGNKTVTRRSRAHGIYLWTILRFVILAIAVDQVDAQTAGERIRTTSTNGVNVRASPGGKRYPEGQTNGAGGVLMDGPLEMKLNASGPVYRWWKVKFDTGQIGWIANGGFQVVLATEAGGSGSAQPPRIPPNAMPVKTTASDKHQNPPLNSAPSVSSKTIDISYFPISFVALARPVPGLKPHFSRNGDLDIRDKANAIEEFSRSVKLPHDPYRIVESMTLYYWSRPEGENVHGLESVEDPKTGTLLFDTLAASYNYATGLMSVERYRLGQNIPTTLVRSTRDIVVEATLNDYDFWMESRVYHNNGTIDNPVKGALLRVYSTDLNEVTAAIKEFKYRVRQTDVVTRETRTLVFDNRNFYRKIFESYITQIKGQAMNIDVEYQYSPEFCDGRIPTRTIMTANNIPIEEATAVNFDRDMRKYVIRVKSLPAGRIGRVETIDLNLFE